MTAPVFLVGTGQLDGASGGTRVVLDGPEGRHAARVRRVAAGEHVDLSDGSGLRASCVVANVLGPRGDALELEVRAIRHDPPPQPRFVAIQALVKGDRAERAVEAMTEVGVDVIIPWAAGRCVERWRADRLDSRLGRWRAAAREASKQSRRSHVPDVRPLAATAQVAGMLGRASLPVVLHEEAPVSLAGVAEVPRRGEIVLVVGPEGGVTPEELAVFSAAGVSPYRLGPTVLRASTAGVAALAMLLARSGRWD